MGAAGYGLGPTRALCGMGGRPVARAGAVLEPVLPALPRLGAVGQKEIDSSHTFDMLSCMNELPTFAARQMRETIEDDRRSAHPPVYPCLNLLGGEAECGRVPATHFARGNESSHGHVCTDCWTSFEEAEKVLYDYVGSRDPGIPFGDLVEHARRGLQRILDSSPEDDEPLSPEEQEQVRDSIEELRAEGVELLGTDSDRSLPKAGVPEGLPSSLGWSTQIPKPSVPSGSLP